MESASHRVYLIDNVCRVLVQHCSKPLLVKFMMLEKKGTIFDACVKELYRTVDYHVIQDMTRDTPRKSKYLDAVIHVTADAPVELVSEHMAPRQLSEVTFAAKPCEPKAAIALRNQCPNIRTIRRQENGRSGQIVTISFDDGKDTGHVHVHDRIDLVPSSATTQFEFPTVSDFPTYFWRKWNIEYTVGMIVLNASQSHGGTDEAMKAYLLDTDRLDQRITELQTGWLPFTLSQLETIAASRTLDMQPLSRITSTVKAFSLQQFDQFITNVGKELRQLHLHTQPHPSRITPLDLPTIVRLIRTQCPKLADLRLPVSFSVGGIDLIDGAIALPPYHLAPGHGTVRKLTIIGYNLGKRQYTDLEEICSWNFARNLACLLALDFELYLSDGSTATSTFSFNDQAGMPTLSWIRWSRSLKKAIRFFQSLGPILEPHLAIHEATPFRMLSFDFIEDLRYHPSGLPICLLLDETWPRHKRAKWRDTDFYRKELYREYMAAMDEEEEERLEARRQEYLDYLDDEEDQRQEALEADRQAYQDYLDDIEEQERDAREEYLEDIERERQAGFQAFEQQDLDQEGSSDADQSDLTDKNSDQSGEKALAHSALPHGMDFQDQLDILDRSAAKVQNRKRPRSSGSSIERCDIDSLSE